MPVLYAHHLLEAYISSVKTVQRRVARKLVWGHRAHRVGCHIPAQEGQERKPFLSMDRNVAFDRRQPWLPELMAPQLVLELWLPAALWIPDRLRVRLWLALPSTMALRWHRFPPAALPPTLEEDYINYQTRRVLVSPMFGLEIVSWKPGWGQGREKWPRYRGT